MNGGGRSNLQPPFVSDYPPARDNLPPPLTLGKRNEDLVHSGGIHTGVYMQLCDLLEQLPNLPDKTVVVITEEIWIAATRVIPTNPDWWEHLASLDAVIISSAHGPDSLHSDGGLPSLSELENDPDVAFCTPTRCDREILEWLQNGEEREATGEELLLAHKLTDTFRPIHVAGDTTI